MPGKHYNSPSYTYDGLDHVEHDTDRDAPTQEALLQEGVNLKHEIDTEYENTAEEFVDNPRSDQAADDVKRHRYPHRWV